MLLNVAKYSLTFFCQLQSSLPSMGYTNHGDRSLPLGNSVCWRNQKCKQVKFTGCQISPLWPRERGRILVLTESFCQPVCNNSKLWRANTTECLVGSHIHQVQTIPQIRWAKADVGNKILQILERGWRVREWNSREMTEELCTWQSNLVRGWGCVTFLY